MEYHVKNHADEIRSSNCLCRDQFLFILDIKEFLFFILNLSLDINLSEYNKAYNHSFARMLSSLFV